MNLSSSLAQRSRYWLLAVVLAALWLGFDGSWRDVENWRATFVEWGAGFWLIALGIQIVCALLMIPTLPVVIASALIFVDAPLLALLLAMSGVLVSALAIYLNARWLGLAESAQRWPRASEWLRRRGAMALLLWCAAPFLPTDAGCYLAASARMPLPRYLAAVLCGELLLCSAMVYGVARLGTA